MMRFIAIVLSLALLLQLTDGFTVDTGRKPLDAAVKSHLFRRDPCHDVALAGGECERRQTRKPLRHALASLAVASLAWRGMEGLPPAAHAARRNPVIEKVAVETKATSGNRIISATGIVLVAGGAGVLVAQAIKPKREAEENPTAVVETSVEEPVGEAEDSDRLKAAQKVVEGILERLKQPLQSKREKSSKPSQQSYLDQLSVNSSKDITEGEGVKSVSYLDTLSNGQASPEGEVHQTVAVDDSVKDDITAETTVTESVRETIPAAAEVATKTVARKLSNASFAKMAPKVFQRDPQPRLDDKALTEKYAKIECLEEKAFTILVDLGLVQISPDPDSPEYNHGKDNQFVE